MRKKVTAEQREKLKKLLSNDAIFLICIAFGTTLISVPVVLIDHIIIDIIKWILTGFGAFFVSGLVFTIILAKLQKKL